MRESLLKQNVRQVTFGKVEQGVSGQRDLGGQGDEGDVPYIFLS